MRQDVVFKFYSDDRHGWIAVKEKYLIELGILDKITSYSYKKGSTVYLEEDQDATTFFRAWESHFGASPRYVSILHNGSSPIRNYEAFQYETLPQLR